MFPVWELEANQSSCKLGAWVPYHLQSAKPLPEYTIFYRHCEPGSQWFLVVCNEIFLQTLLISPLCPPACHTFSGTCFSNIICTTHILSALSYPSEIIFLGMYTDKKIIVFKILCTCVLHSESTQAESECTKINTGVALKKKKLCGVRKILILIYIFNCSWVDTRWQQYITHLHTNSTLTHKQYA
jgi:hypothetical protein